MNDTVTLHNNTYTSSENKRFFSSSESDILLSRSSDTDMSLCLNGGALGAELEDVGAGEDVANDLLLLEVGLVPT